MIVLYSHNQINTLVKIPLKFVTLNPLIYSKKLQSWDYFAVQYIKLIYAWTSIMLNNICKKLTIIEQQMKNAR